ncbi:MAG: helix-turn-helix domain-containing protein [Candidatus Aenigmatarchaeota archaeon]
MLLNSVESILQKAGFEYSEYCGCFDIIARRDFTLLLKVLMNVDSFQNEQANNLKVLSNNLKAFSALIGIQTRYDKLRDNIIYERFGIPTFTQKTLENIVHGYQPLTRRFRGGLFIEINPEKLRKKRIDAGFTQEELANRVGVTKKSIYEHEQRTMHARQSVVLKIENIIGRISEPTKLECKFADIENKPSCRFESTVSCDMRRAGFKTDFVHQTPFNIIAKDERFITFLDAEEHEKTIKKKVPYMLGFSEIMKKSVLVVTKKSIDVAVPTLKESELKGMKPKDIRKILM